MVEKKDFDCIVEEAHKNIRLSEEEHRELRKKVKEQIEKEENCKHNFVRTPFASQTLGPSCGYEICTECGATRSTHRIRYKNN